MATPATREQLKQYALRALGKPVIEINVDDDQLEDRLDEALQYFAQYHYDGVERTYLKYQLTQADKDRITSNTSSSITKNSVTTSWKEGNNYIIVPEAVLAVTKIFSLSDKSNLNMFDVRYQLRLNDLYDFSSTSIIHYDMVRRHLDLLDHILVGEKPIRFNQYNNRLYVDMDWTNDLQVGEYLVIECYRKLDPETMTDVYNDIFLKRYVTALFRKTMGRKFTKFNGVTMIGGVTLKW
jgi:predicted transcriptional regulator